MAAVENRDLLSTERRLLRHMLGSSQSSVLMTDAYKFAMAQAGDPLRPETFYLSFRRPGLYYVPFDLEALVAMLVPSEPTNDERRYLARHGYGLSDAMREALAGSLQVWAAPKDSWVQEREPIVRISGPCFLVSWLESLVIWLQFPMQVATEALLHGRRHFFCSCEDEAEIVRLSLEAAGVLHRARVQVDASAYAAGVRGNAKRLANALGGTLTRVFEVGMRSASCMEMHRIALSEIRKHDVAGSSNLFLASELALPPVGTTGHEHQMRFASDLEAFRAIRDRRSETPSYLFDTFDALGLGIPAAITALRESPERAASVRFDSGEPRPQLEAFLTAGVAPTFIFMDGIDDKKAAALVSLQSEMDASGKPWLFGVGGYFVGRASLMSLTRDRVSAVYKLCESGGRPVMKFSVPGKESIPGKPVVWRIGTSASMQSVIAQEGERLGPGVRLATESSKNDPPSPVGPPILSPETQELVRRLSKAKEISTSTPKQKEQSHEHPTTRY